METTFAYIGLGSNLNHPVEQIKQARTAIASLESTQEKRFSSLYRTDPMGPDQPDYINAVMAVETCLSPEALLTRLQNIERDQGRVRRGDRWGPRTLDLDILLFGRYCTRTERLTLPHYGIAERAFVLYPLAEIAPPNLLIPGKGLLRDLLRRCPPEGIQRLGENDVV